MDWLTVCALILSFVSPVIADKTVRDRDSNVIEIIENRGSSTIVRDQYGNIIGSWYYDDILDDEGTDEPHVHLRYEDRQHE